MHLFSKMKRFLAGLFIAISGLLIISFIVTLPWFIPPFFPGLAEIDTQYTQNFSYENFATVKEGMTKDDVTQILGKPFFIWKPGNECWKYSKNGRTGSNGLSDYLGWVLVQVCFGEDGKVVATPRTIFYN